MARRRSYGRRFGRVRRVGRGLGSSLRSGAIGNGLKGIGGGLSAEIITDSVAPNYSNVSGFVGSYFAGGFPGLIAHTVRKFATGGLVNPFGSGCGGGAL